MRTPDPNDWWWNRAEADPRSKGEPRESVTDAQLQRRLADALSLLKTLRRQEREQAR